MTVDDEHKPPCIRERYGVATNASNLRTVSDKGGATDVLIAAAWSPSRLGSALMRLHTKADRAGLELVQMQVAMQAAKWRIDNPDVVAASTIKWWLAKTCPMCSGQKFERIPDTPALSATRCRACDATGERKLPYGYEGRRLANFMDDAVQEAVKSIQQRLRPGVKKEKP